MRALSQLTTNPFEVKLTDRSQSPKEGAISPPLLVIEDGRDQRGALGRESSRLPSDRTQKPTPLGSPTSSMPSLAEIQLREAATPQFLAKTAVSPEIDPPPLQRIPEDWKREWLALPPNLISHPASERGDFRVPSPAQASVRSWNTEIQRIWDQPASEKSSIHGEAPKASLLPGNESLSSRHSHQTTRKSQEIASEESKRSTPKSLDLRVLTGSSGLGFRTEVGLASLLEEARDSPSANSSGMQGLRGQSEEGRDEELHPKLESAQLLAERIAHLHYIYTNDLQISALQAIISWSPPNIADTFEESQLAQMDYIYANHLKNRAFVGWHRVTRLHRTALEFQFKRKERQLYQWFKGYYKVFQAHRLWLEEVREEFRNRQLLALIVGWSRYTQYRRVKLAIAEKRYRRLLTGLIEAWRQWTMTSKSKAMRAYVYWYGTLTHRAIRSWRDVLIRKEKTRTATNYHKASLMLKFFFKWKNEHQRPTHDSIPLRITHHTAISRKGDKLIKRKTLDVKVINL